MKRPGSRGQIHGEYPERKRLAVAKIREGSQGVEAPKSRKGCPDSVVRTQMERPRERSDWSDE
jgi:hypothetical protein